MKKIYILCFQFNIYYSYLCNQKLREEYVAHKI